MGHIEIAITLGTSVFKSKCSSAGEAFDVIRDAYSGIHGVSMDEKEADDWMEVLVQMMRGGAISREWSRLRVKAVQGKEEPT